MKKMFITISGLLLMVLIMSSCNKNGETGINLSFKASTAAFKSLAGGAFEFSEALIGVHEISIEAESEEFDDDDSQGSDSDFEYDYEGNYSVDLLTGVSSPEIGFADFVPGTYNEVEVELTTVLEGGTLSMIIKGTNTDGGNSIDFEFSTAAEIEFEVESDMGFYLDEGTILDLVLKIDLISLFDGVDFSQAQLNDNNVAIINDNTNTELAAIIRSNIHHCSDLEEDHEDSDDD